MPLRRSFGCGWMEKKGVDENTWRVVNFETEQWKVVFATMYLSVALGG